MTPKTPLDTLASLALDYRNTSPPTLLNLEPTALTLAHRLKAYTGAYSVIVLATCNRFEAYFEAQGDPLTLVERAKHLPPFKNASPHIRVGEDAARHLLRVSAGLESAIPGDREIPYQVKRSLRHHLREGLVREGSLLYALFLKAAHLGEKIVKKNLWGEAGRGYPARAFSFIASTLDGEKELRILILGGGIAARSLIETACANKQVAVDIILLTRNPRAKSWNNTCTGRGRLKIQEPGELESILKKGWRPMAVVNTSHRWKLEQVISLLKATRRYSKALKRPLVVVDLTQYKLPPKAEANIRLIALKDLEDMSPLDERGEHAQPMIEHVVEEELQRLLRELKSSMWERQIALIMTYALRLSRAEALRASRLPPEKLSNGQLLVFFDSFSRKLLHPLLQALRDASAGRELPAAIEERIKEAERRLDGN